MAFVYGLGFLLACRLRLVVGGLRPIHYNSSENKVVSHIGVTHCTSALCWLEANHKVSTCSKRGNIDPPLFNGKNGKEFVDRVRTAIVSHKGCLIIFS
jgi:hypothetical protein